jgi:hypothetical protein
MSIWHLRSRCRAAAPRVHRWPSRPWSLANWRRMPCYLPSRWDVGQQTRVAPHQCATNLLHMHNARKQTFALQHGLRPAVGRDVLQAEAIDAATVSLAAGLRSLAGRLAALSGPVADTGVSAQPMAAVPLLGSTDEDEDAAAPLAAEASGQRSVAGGNHAIVNDPTDVDGDLGVTVTSAAPSNGAVTPGTGAFFISLHERMSLCFTCRAARAYQTCVLHSPAMFQLPRMVCRVLDQRC